MKRFRLERCDLSPDSDSMDSIEFSLTEHAVYVGTQSPYIPPGTHIISCSSCIKRIKPTSFVHRASKWVRRPILLNIRVVMILLRDFV